MFPRPSCSLHGHPSKAWAKPSTLVPPLPAPPPDKPWACPSPFVAAEGKMEKAMAPHSSTPAWKIPWAEEPGGLQSTGSRKITHD